jgi:hypothetical protein
MLFPQARYEIEFRCAFASDAEAYRILPFLKASFTREYTWFDNYHGLKVYKRGQVLRASGVDDHGHKRYFLGWKGPDTGTFANIRRELDVETTKGLAESPVMQHFCSLQQAWKAEEIEPTLEKAGYEKFMSYQGHSFVGRSEELGVNTKIMHCEILKYPLLVELEKLADSKAAALQCQHDLESIAKNYNLSPFLVKEEPGTLLYQATFEK